MIMISKEDEKIELENPIELGAKTGKGIDIGTTFIKCAHKKEIKQPLKASAMLSLK